LPECAATPKMRREDVSWGNKKMTRAREFAAAVLAAGVLLLPALARADDPSLIALGAGDIDFDHNEPAGELRGEYRFAQGFYFIKPMVGAFGTSRHSVYAYGGLRADLVFWDHYVVMPNAAVGWYDRGNGKDLGTPIEFKTGVEFAYRWDGGTRLGVAFDHISNAGLSRHNPGTEQLLLMLSLPVPW
jgi:lipid A 3-O-deacylase